MNEGAIKALDINSRNFQERADNQQKTIADLKVQLGRSKIKLETARKRLRIALAPWAVLFLPFTIAWAIWRWQNRRRSAKAILHPAQATSPSSSERNHLIKCMNILWADGTAKALDELRGRPQALPIGVESLFLAYDAANDAEWLRHTSDWLRHQSSMKLSLRPGTEPRFNRIQFADTPPNHNAPEKISVIMPAFNSAASVETAVLSILSQTWSNLELIAIDDCSTDGTGETLDRLARSDARVKVLHNPVNVGPYVSKNAGLSVATGAYVTGHDADDIALPDRLERQVELLRHDANTVATIGYMIRMNEQGLFNFASKWPTTMSYDGVLRLASISLLIRRSDLLKVGYWDCVRFGADSELIARLQKVFPGRVRQQRILTMLCCNEVGSLTNNAEHGISPLTGVSPIRMEYRAAWERWHRGLADASSAYVEFGNSNRHFVAPESMIVSEDDIQRIRSSHAVGA